MIHNSSYLKNESLINKNYNNINIEQLHEKSKKIMEKENSDIEKKFDELFVLDENKKSCLDKNDYYLINKQWIDNFKKFTKSQKNYNESFPGEINNKNIIIQNEEVLKLDKETKIFFNNKYNLDNSCLFIKKDLWKKLLKLFGGGPEYPIIPSNSKLTNLIKEGGHIDLIYIHNKKAILGNQNFILNNYIYFNLNSDVKSLRNYINKILNSNMEKFKIRIKNKIKETLEEKKHYRLWLYSGFFGQPTSISEFLSRKIIRFLDNHNIQNSLIDLKELGAFQNGYVFKMIPLSNFDNNIVKDIFPNDYTKCFNYSQFNKFKYKDKNDLPRFTIIIEENPYIFENDNIIYKIGKCYNCDFTEIVFSSCQCEKLFFCCNTCRDKKIQEHFFNCKIFLTNHYKKENFNYSKEKSKFYSLIGLLNLGNTCYMNSALQCIRAIKELTNYFLNYFDETQLNINNSLGTGGFLTLAYVNFLYNLNNCHKEYYTPKNFKNSIGIVDDRYSGKDQQDTHEFMNFLIDCLHEDLNKVINKPIIKRKDSDISNNYSNELIEQKSIIEWNNHLKRNQSIMVDLLYGQYKTTISCPSCKYKSINFSIFCSQQLPIPKKEYFIIKVIFMEEEPNLFQTIKLNIILNKQNNKIFIAKQIIGKILEISPHQIEIVKYKSKEIIKTYENEEEIDEDTNIIWAIKINLESFEIIEENIYALNKIDYINLKENLTKKNDEIIKIFENNNIDNNIDNKKIDYEKFEMQKFIIKYYYIYDSSISNDIFNEDSLIYLQTNITCSDLYYKIFEIYNSIKFLQNYLENFNKEYDKIEIFQLMFKEFIENETNELTNDIFEKYQKIPFVLKLEDNYSKKSIFIPPSKEYFFKNFINDNFNLETDNNQNNYNNEVEKEDSLNKSIINDIEINILSSQPQPNENDLAEDNIGKIHSLGNNCERRLDNENENNLNNNFSNNLIVPSPINDNLNFSTEQKEKDIKINITKYKSEEGKNNKIKKIIIIWNSKFLKKNESEQNYYLFKKPSSEAIDLCSFTQKIFENNFQKIEIDKCFEEFSKEETFDKDNLWNCPKCKKNIEAKNKIEIYQVPKILILQLKRFKNNKKIETLINFPLKNLDMSKFISASSLNNDIPLKYDLFAVANHYGRLDYGHYDAYCLNYLDNYWYNFNDRIVTKIKKEEEEKEIISKNAYVLFYKQQKNDLIDWEKVYNKKFENINENNIKRFGQDFYYKKENPFNINLNWDELDMGSSIINHINEKKIEIFENEETFSNISLNSFIYNPFKESYLKIKRKRKYI
jgi:ubiquitin C-terminal hydrolase